MSSSRTSPPPGFSSKAFSTISSQKRKEVFTVNLFQTRIDPFEQHTTLHLFRQRLKVIPCYLLYFLTKLHLGRSLQWSYSVASRSQCGCTGQLQVWLCNLTKLNNVTIFWLLTVSIWNYSSVVHSLVWWCSVKTVSIYCSQAPLLQPLTQKPLW